VGFLDEVEVEFLDEVKARLGYILVQGLQSLRAGGNKVF